MRAISDGVALGFGSVLRNRHVRSAEHHGPLWPRFVGRLIRPCFRHHCPRNQILVVLPASMPARMPANNCAARSEEHTSELQSLMRISYAVFCLKKKNNRYKKQQTHNISAQKRQRTKEK